MPAPRTKKQAKAPEPIAQVEERMHTPEPMEPAISMITAAQKQQLLDHLQHEVAGRARKLRAQYALHARSLRDRLEMRINRIPHNLRKMNIEELIDRYKDDLETTKSRPLPTIPSKAPLQISRPLPKPPVNLATGPSATLSRGVKRPSADISIISEDKENINHDLDLPKKRAKTALGPSANSGTMRTATGASRQLNPSQVLSPKSHNSRTLPRSPIRPAVSPTRSMLARPVSPIKTQPSSLFAPNLPHPVAPKAKAPSRAASKQSTTTSASIATGTTRGRSKVVVTKTTTSAPTAQSRTGRARATSQASNSSDASAATTIVKKAVPARKGITGKVTGLAGGGTKRAAASKAAPVPAPSANPTGRSLRSRK